MATNNTVNCPECGKTLELVQKIGNPLRVQAFCDCGKGIMRAVYESDAGMDYRIDQYEPPAVYASAKSYQKRSK